MSGFSAIDLSQIAAPAVVETLDYEAILQAMRDDLVARDPSFTALLESDPAIKLLEVAAWRELLLRQRVNDAARAVMLAHAVGSDLDNLAALFSVQRQIVDPGDPEAVPPVAPTYEDDERLRRRTQLALEGFSVAGPAGAYIFHALSADGAVHDVAVASPTPGQVIVTILSASGDGTADAALLANVSAVLDDDDVRPLTDQLTVQSAGIVGYSVSASLDLASGPDPEVVRQKAVDGLAAYVAARHRIGLAVTISGLHAAATVEGVHKVTLSAPAADIEPSDSQAAHCSSIDVVIA